jgi:hypothetical protein
MGKLGWNIAASIGLIAFSQTVSATADSRVPKVVSVHRNITPPYDPKYLLAQAGEPRESATTPPLDSKQPQDQSSPAVSSPPAATSTAEVPRPERTVPGCALKYMAAELSGKLKGRKWKEFRQQECGASSIEVVFPSTVAPKYSGDSPEKARTLTCADQFNANKASNGNGGMKWIEKGGGYYSECVVRLKG